MWPRNSKSVRSEQWIQDALDFAPSLHVSNWFSCWQEILNVGESNYPDKQKPKHTENLNQINCTSDASFILFLVKFLSSQEYFVSVYTVPETWSIIKPEVNQLFINFSRRGSPFDVRSNNPMKSSHHFCIKDCNEKKRAYHLRQSCISSELSMKYAAFALMM